MYSWGENLLIGLKWCASFFKRKWTFDDYPLRARRNGEDPPEGQEWVAQILNWPGPAGIGGSKVEAVEALRENLEKIGIHRESNGKTMPRPGSNVPIQFAPSGRVRSDPDLHDDFIDRILEFEPGDYTFISDVSSLGDFGDESYVVTLQERIYHAYHVDVSDLESGLLCEIFERIQKKAANQASEVTASSRTSS